MKRRLLVLLYNRRPMKLLLALFLSFLIVTTACRPQPEPQPPTEAVKIMVGADGLYRLSLTDLATAGLAVDDLTTAALALTLDGQPIPYTIYDDGLVFYGRAPTSRYAAQRAYILRQGTAGPRLVEQPVPPTAAPPISSFSRHLWLEENMLYESRAAALNGALDFGYDPWFWQTLQVQSRVELAVDLPAVASGAGQIRIGLWGVTEDRSLAIDHDFDLLLNGQKLTTVAWKGTVYHIAEVELPAGSLQNGRNSLTLDNSVPGATFVDIMRLDWVEIVYDSLPQAVEDRLTARQIDGRLALTGFSRSPLLVNVADPDEPRLLTGWSYADGTAQLHPTEPVTLTAAGPAGFLTAGILPLRESDWRSPDQQADLIVISTDSLIPALAPLVEAREAAGIRTAVVPLDEIYDGFGFGQPVPQAITAFLQYAVASWQEPAPRYLLLVGEATYDHRAYRQPLPPNHLPTKIVPVQHGGETISDSRLADVTGDGRPDLAVGRWPVGEPAAVADLVARTLAYEQATAATQAIFAADGSSTEFTGLSDRLLQNLDLPAEGVNRLYDLSATSFIDLWNQGSWLVNYTGHGSMEQWGQEAIFSSRAVTDLAAAAPPIVIQLTCLTGFFAHPTNSSLSETMLTHRQGPPLVIAATSLTLSSHQAPFATELLAGLTDPAVARIGDAFLAAQRSLDISVSGLREISDTFVLLGDPSAIIVRP